MKVCTRCKVEKDLALFTKAKTKSGVSSWCKSCSNEYQRQHRSKDREKWRKYSRDWAENHKEKELDRYKKYRERNRETIREKSRIRMANKRNKDKEGSLKYTRDYRRRNPEKAAFWDRMKKYKRRAAMRGDSIKLSEWNELKARYDHSCVYCLQKTNKLTMDHVIPLSKGGKHSIENIVPACGSCNSSKHVKDIYLWVQSKHGRLL